MKYLVTGGAGFIGSNFINSILTQNNLGVSAISVLDKLTYAGSLGNIKEGIRSEVEFFRGDICDESVVAKAMRGVDIVVILQLNLMLIDLLNREELSLHLIS